MGTLIDAVAREKIDATQQRLDVIERKQDDVAADLSEIRATLAGLAPWVKAGSVAATGIVMTLIVLVVERAVI